MRTEIITITDRSGSMQSIRNDVIGGFNAFIAEQKKVPGEARITYAQFDDHYEVVYAGKPLADAPELTEETFVPRGSTALLDAIGRTLNDQGARIARDKWAELVIVAIVTDGHENASREYTRDRVKEMTKHAEANGWKFVYLAADQNAFAAAQALGMQNAVSNTFGKSMAGTQSAYDSFSYTSRSFRTGGDGKLSAEVQKKLDDSVKAAP